MPADSPSAPKDARASDRGVPAGEGAHEFVSQHPELAALSRAELEGLLEAYAKNWLAHDGLWFQAVEERFGMDAAIELDTRAWDRFSVIEARRIMALFGISPGGGIDALERALNFRLYATVNLQAAERVDRDTLRFRMTTCRVQEARRRKQLPDFPCKPVGLVEYSRFAETVDPRIRTRCVSCPPDAVGPGYCEWEFTLGGGTEGEEAP